MLSPHEETQTSEIFCVLHIENQNGQTVWGGVGGRGRGGRSREWGVDVVSSACCYLVSEMRGVHLTEEREGLVEV